MVEYEKERTLRIDFPCDEFFVRERRHRHEVIDRRRSDLQSPLRVFTHAEYSFATLCGSGEMDVRELRDRVPHRFVRNAFGAVAAVNMGDKPPANRRGGRGRHRFDSITENQNHIGAQPFECAGKTFNPAAERYGVLGPSRPPDSLHFDPGGDLKFRFDIDS